jgi:hypothetical protein
VASTPSYIPITVLHKRFQSILFNQLFNQQQLKATNYQLVTESVPAFEYLVAVQGLYAEEMELGQERFLRP